MKNFLYQLNLWFNLWFSRLNAYLSTKNPLHGSQLAAFHELVKLYTDKRNISKKMLCLFLAVGKHNQLLYVRPTERRPQLGNLGLFIPTGGGKTQFLITHLLTWPHSAIVNDPKGDLFRKTAGYRAIFSDVYVFDPTGNGNCFDPLIGKNTEDELYAVAKLLLYEPNEREPAFTERGIKMLKLLFLLAKDKGFSPFPFVSQIARLGGINNAAERMHKLSPEIAKVFLDGEYKPNTDYAENRFLANSYESLTARLEPFLTETVVKSLKGADFSISDFMLGEKSVTLYLNWPESKLLAMQPLMKLMYGTFLEGLKHVYDNAPDKTKCREVSFPTDEAGITPIPELFKHIATVRSRKMSFLLAYQNISQLHAHYGEYHARTILGNMRVQ
jgi:type IV secretion system protein VirD4